MKILVLNWQDIRNPFGGGAEVHLHQIFRRLVQQGHEVTLFCSSFEGADPEEDIDGIHIVRQGHRNTFNFVVPSAYRRRFSHDRYDVVVDDINKIPFYTPLFVREPLLGMVLHLFSTSIFREASFPAASYVYATERLALKVYRQTPIAVISESTRQELLSNRFPEENLIDVGVAVDHTIYHPVDVPRSGFPHIGYVGRIKKYKSVDHLLHAFAIVRQRLPEARLTVIGDGDGKPALEKLARSLGLSEAVTFTGYLPASEKVRLMNTMHVVANTSVKEGWGLTVTEANACGVPVVASNVPGLRDAIRDGTTGLLYTYGRTDELAEKLLRLLQDGALRERMGKAALECAGTFTWDRCADTMTKAIDLALGRSRAR